MFPDPCPFLGSQHILSHQFVRD
uniref:Uncharacterized protein n=1 Tax=Arundo donax TaxID=35708 RepID=A0A0A9A1C3_ARUDO